MDGNSFSSSAFVLPEAAIVTVHPLTNSCFIKGIQRVAWPKPQSNGANRIFFDLKFCSKFKSSIINM